MAALSISERGRSAERMPMGMATSRTKIMPPNTRDAVTGAAREISSFTERRLTNEYPSS
jgi:hypothetical protein